MKNYSLIFFTMAIFFGFSTLHDPIFYEKYKSCECNPNTFDRKNRYIISFEDNSGLLQSCYTDSPDVCRDIASTCYYVPFSDSNCPSIDSISRKSVWIIVIAVVNLILIFIDYILRILLSW